MTPLAHAIARDIRAHARVIELKRRVKVAHHVPPAARHLKIRMRVKALQLNSLAAAGHLDWSSVVGERRYDPCLCSRLSSSNLTRVARGARSVG
jgi:hypothetical protein